MHNGRTTKAAYRQFWSFRLYCRFWSLCGSNILRSSHRSLRAEGGTPRTLPDSPLPSRRRERETKGTRYNNRRTFASTTALFSAVVQSVFFCVKLPRCASFLGASTRSDTRSRCSGGLRMRLHFAELGAQHRARLAALLEAYCYDGFIPANHVSTFFFSIFH